MSQFLTKLCVQEVDEFAGLWELHEQLVYRSDLLGKTVIVPAGFRSDFASVPRLPIIYLAVGGKGERAAVVHDWLYSSQSVSRQQADAVLQEALLASGYSSLVAGLFYAAVRVGGGFHWTAPNVPQPDHVTKAMQAA